MSEKSSSQEPAAARVKALYSVMQTIENRIGGGEGVEGLYGSINRSGMQKIVDCMRASCGLDGSSHLVDIGAGLGRPLMHALVDPGISAASGVEIDRIKCDKAAAFLQRSILELQRRGVLGAGEPPEPPQIQCRAIEQVKTLDPCTHAYSFWEGVPMDGKAGFGRLFAASRTLRAVAVVQRAMRGATSPAEVMAGLGFGKLALVESFSVSMSGSGRSFTCYVFNRAAHPTPLALPRLPALLPAADSVDTPSQRHEGGGAGLSQGGLGPAVGAEAELEDEAVSAPPPLPPAELLPPRGEGSSAVRRSTRQRRPTAKVVEGAEEPEQQGVALEPQAGSRQPNCSRAQRSTHRTAAAAATVVRAAGGKQRASPSKGNSVQKASPSKAASSPSKAKAQGLLGAAGAALRQKKLAPLGAATAGAKPAKQAAAGGAEPTARRGLLQAVGAVTRSMQSALSPGSQRAAAAAAHIIKAQ